jgi:hypothetical protein
MPFRKITAIVFATLGGFYVVGELLKHIIKDYTDDGK